MSCTASALLHFDLYYIYIFLKKYINLLNNYFMCFTVFHLTQMAPRRTQAQKEHLAAMRAQRCQDGGPGVSVQREDVESEEILELKAAQKTAEDALEKVKAQLQAEQDYRDDLTRELRVERRKVLRVKTAKDRAETSAADAQNSVEVLEEKIAQLTLQNEQLEMTMSALLDRWSKEKQIAKETMQELRKKVKALQDKCQRAPDIFKRALQQSKSEGQRFSLVEKGVYTEEARELCRILVNAGCSQEFVGDVIEEVLHAAGISVVGSTMSSRTVRRAVLEGGVMADIQMGHEIANAKGLTVSNDGTTHKNIDYVARHINMPVSIHDVHTIQHQSRLVGVDPSADHSS
jgi:hypothetical protein